MAPSFSEKIKELTELLELHKKSDPTDPSLGYYQGEREYLDGNFSGAMQHFVVAMEHSKRQHQWRIRTALIKTGLKLGRVDETFRQLESTEAAFDEIAMACVREKNAKELKALFTVVRTDHPEFKNLPLRELELRWLDKDYAGALQWYEQNRQETFERTRFRWQSNNYRLRCLVKLKREQETLKIYEDLAKRHSVAPILKILALASLGDVQKVIAEVEKQSPDTYLLREYYDDDDVGPILKSDAFKAFRDKFPEPKKEPDED